MMDIKNVNIEDFIKRVHTVELEENPEKTVYDLFNWKKVDVFLKDYKTGSILYDEKELEFPEDYTQNSCDIIASKYFKRANVPNDRGKEYSMRQVAHRMVKFWMEAGLDEGILDEITAPIFYDEVVYTILAQMAAPNSPQWFNTGLKYYNTGEETDGHFYYDLKEKEVKVAQDKYGRTQASACFILSMEDRLLGKKSISDQYVTETRLFKHGSGTGTNYSNLRAKGEKLSGGGTSSGAISFMKGLDKNAGTIKSGGTTRRAARMLQLDVDHPEVLDYIKWKAEQEDIARALGKMGYDLAFDGLIYETVSGQNGNNTVRFNDEYMKKLTVYLTTGEDSDFELKGRIDKSINRKVKVSKIWNDFCQAAWECADPAPSFDEHYNAWHTCPAGEDGELWAKHNRINSTNPCGEYAFLDDTACNLASINVKRFYNVDTKDFDVAGYLHTVFLWELVLEFTVHWGQFPVEEVARKTHMFRTTGLGIANTASIHLLMGHPYDSEEARTVAASIMSMMTGYAYLASALMAKKVGTFEAYSINEQYMLEVIRNHARVSGSRSDKYERLNYKPVKLNHALLNKLGWNNVSENVKLVWNATVAAGEKYGYRNAQATVIAPTGTIAFAMDCEATSIEPFFAHTIYKKLVGGGGMVIVNPLIEKALSQLGYRDDELTIISEAINAGNIESCPLIKPEHLAIFDTANKIGTGQRYIAPMGHVKMMAALMPMVSGAISKTVNLPKEATKEDMSFIFFEAFKLGVKGITCYRDGCKATQPLNNTTALDKKVTLADLGYHDLLKKAQDMQYAALHPERIKPHGIVDGHKHVAVLDGLKLQVKIFFYEETKEICEIYVTADKEGTLVKGLLDSLSKQMSKMFQYNVPIQDIIKSLKGQKYEPHGFVTEHPYIKYADSISDLIAKILEIEIGDYSSCQVKPVVAEMAKQVIAATSKPAMVEIKKPDLHAAKGERVYGKTCPSCGSNKMQKNGTCYVCIECGSTTGCS